MGTKPTPKFTDETSGGLSAATAATQGPVSSSNLDVILELGTVLGGRYEILEMLGIGGMGAVYKAQDRELDRVIALKVVRPDLARNPEILQRFKQELLTARQVTHKNVIRIFDLAEADGIKFITMEYVAGPDLRRLLADHGKLPPAEAVDIIRQVCAGVAAAHAEGVIHRDLKPGNILRDAQGRVVVMDFGLARTITGDGMTKTGAMLGTVEYMSPEQAKAEKLDARSDLFTIGLILYELLTGKTPYQADSAIATLLKRTQEAAMPAYQVDPEVPRALSDILSKAIERDPNQRYQTVQEFIDHLDEYQGKRPASGIRIAPAFPRKRWMLLGIAAVLVLVIAVAAKLWMTRSRATTTVPHAAVSVLVADFTNHTGDPIFDGTLEPMFNVALEGASFINAFNRGSARKLAQKLPHPTEKLDEQAARLVALGQGIAAVVTGELSQRGDGYKLSVEALDARTGNSIATGEVSTSNKDELLLAVPKLVAPIRKALGDTTPKSVQLSAGWGAFQAASLEAVHQYGIGTEQQFAGKNEDSFKSFSKAVELDPNFARAYFAMATSAGNVGKPQDAEKYMKMAMAHVDRMTERERYRIRGYYYFMSGNAEKCIEEYSELVKNYPADNIGHANLSICYKIQHNTPKAIEEVQRALEISPRNQLARVNLASYLSYTGDFPAAEREARAVLQANPSYETGYAALAYAQVGQSQLAEAIKTYRQLEKVSNLGQSMAAPGLADIALYEGRLTDAVRLLEAGAAGDLQAGRLDSAAADFVALGYVQLLRKQKAAALAALEKALDKSKAVSPRFAAARIYVAADETSKARKLADGLATESQLEPRVYAKLIEGEAALQEKNPHHAIELFNEANKLFDTWIGRFDLGRAYLETGLFTEADSEFDRCIKRRGETLDLFDYVTNYSYLPEVYYYQGRVREGLKSPGAAESYRTYLSIRGEAGEDPLLPEIRRRLGQ